jgi:tyrosinase
MVDFASRLVVCNKSALGGQTSVLRVFMKIQYSNQVIFGALVALGALLASMDASSAQTSVEIQIRQTASVADDYVCWAPVKSRARLLNPENNDVSVVLKVSQASPSAGSVAFLHSGDQPSTANQKTELNLVLRKDGSWSDFVVIGTHASRSGKDVGIRAETANGQIVGTQTLMVRVRKDAEKLTVPERNAFLRALAAWKKKLGQSRPTRFEDLYTAHADAFKLGIHSNFGQNVSNFLPWHRALLLSFERELQEIDPTVALPYWKFDEPAPNLFSADFMGNLSQQSTDVAFDIANPLRGWSISSGETLRRSKVWPDKPAVRPGTLEKILCLDNGPSCPKGDTLYRAFTDSLEINYHNLAHAQVAGWLGDAASPRDPLFFLLHANVDRGWAHWQATHDGFKIDATGKAAYRPTGAYPGPDALGRFRKGLYGDDEMWPWGTQAPGANSDPMASWLPYRFTFPAAESLPLTPDAPPVPLKMADYLGVFSLGDALGFCYDDIRYDGEGMAN